MVVISENDNVYINHHDIENNEDDNNKTTRTATMIITLKSNKNNEYDFVI